MSDSHTPVCPRCGARLPQGADACDLCGASLASEDEEAAEEPTQEATPAQAAAAEEPKGVFCNACGWQNPPGANYCSRCGTRLQPAAAAAPPPAAAPSGGAEASEAAPAARDGLARQVALVVGLAALVVAGLFIITTLSDGTSPTTPPPTGDAAGAAEPPSAAGQLEAAPLSPAVADSVEALEEEIARLEGEEKQARQRALVGLLLRAGHVDRAARAQRALAQVENTAAAWRRAGDLLYRWMTTVEGPDKAEVAALTIDAYEHVLDENPGDLDARTNMAWASQFDPSQNPMQAIEMTNAVLEENPEHLQANLNRGLFLARINRLEEALQQFEQVKEMAGEGSPAYQQAERYLQVVQDVEERGDTGAPSGR